MGTVLSTGGNVLLSAAEHRLLVSLQGTPVAQLVWDINAIYVVESDRTVKVSAIADRPSAADADTYDEATFIGVSIDRNSRTFHSQGEPGRWYQVVAESSRIVQIEIVRSYIGTPGSWLVPPAERETTAKTVTPVDCGILITTPEGVLPAVQLGHSYGFAVWPEVRLYTREEVLTSLADKYEVRPVEPESTIVRAI